MAIYEGADHMRREVARQRSRSPLLSENILIPDRNFEFDKNISRDAPAAQHCSPASVLTLFGSTSTRTIRG